MIFDKTLQFSDNQAITGDAASTNVVDTGAYNTVNNATNPPARDQGKGNKVPLLIQVTEDFATLTSLEIKVQCDDNEAFGSPKDVATTGVIAVADLKKGKQFSIDVLPKGTNERFIRLYYDVTGTNATAGKITAGVVAGVQEA